MNAAAAPAAANPQSIAPHAEHAKSQRAPASDADLLDVATLVDLWLANVAAYGPKWTSRAGELPIDDEGRLTIAGGVWARGLSGMSRAAVLGALERHARVSAWPAELSELRALCLGVPTLGEVRVMLRDESARKPPFVVLMFQQLDYYNWKMADQRTADRWLADAYATAREHVMLGGALPEVKGELAPPEQDARRAPVVTVDATAYAQGREEFHARARSSAESTFAEAREAFGARARGKDAAAGPDA